MTPQQAQRRVDICHLLISNPMDDRFIRRIVTCDEKWIYHRNPDALKKWLGSHQHAKVIVKKIDSAPKYLLVLTCYSFTRVFVKGQGVI